MMMHAPSPRVLSVNVGLIRQVKWRGRHITTAIWKDAVDGRMAIRGVNFVGDDQADRTVHGGPDKAIYAYSREDYEYWHVEHGLETPHGLFGENLTTEGLDLSNALLGERWSVGSALLEVAQIRLPCFKLGIRMGDSHFPKRFMAASRMGAYLRVIEEGDVGAHDPIRVLSKPAHGVTLRVMMNALQDSHAAAALRLVAYLPEFWRRVANE